MNKPLSSEAGVKGAVKILLAKYSVYYFMPVNMGYGAAGLDFHCLLTVGQVPIAFFIETKAPGKALTGRQDLLIEKLKTRHKANVFVIDGYGSEYRRLERWLEQMQNTSILIQKFPEDTRRVSTSGLKSR